MRSVPFSAKAEYACIAMVELAARHGDPQPVPLKAIADAHGLKHRFLVQILLQLKGVGLVVTTRGAAGGYQLGRPPDQISLADVIGVIDRGPRTAARAEEETVSPVKQAIRNVWKQVQAVQQRALEETTLAELVQRAREGQELTYQI
jgi:Rrf2 family cysteine metabolism transcriptional repressor